MAPEREGEIRKRGKVSAEQARDPRRIVRAERFPCFLRQLILLRRYLRASLIQLVKLCRGQWRDVPVNLNQRELLPARRAARKKVEELDQLELVVEVVLEPENHFVEVIQVLNYTVALGEVSAHVREISPAPLRDESRPLLAQRV